MREFDVKTGSWMSYVDRLFMYLHANGIKDELIMPTMISLMGDEAYELLRASAAPRRRLITIGNCRGCGATGHGYECRFHAASAIQDHPRRVCPNEGTSRAVLPGGRDRGFHYGQAADDSESDEEPEEELCLHQLCLKDYKAIGGL
ncbi:putative retropepsins like ltr [Operophtera brumata]|uniref:Putative retropepsins like ltr n=1 Tax=Operophtera brumata TaxID=104452 RepID=A0A0L7K4K7_OPEBR|nr:putative retropepsins like ltr [Operophtera brumata]